jgi:hypothetical protein
LGSYLISRCWFRDNEIERTEQEYLRRKILAQKRRAMKVIKRGASGKLAEILINYRVILS